MKPFKYILIVYFILTHSINFSQVTIDTSCSINSLVDSILIGKGIRAGNIKLKGHKIGVGLFEVDSLVIGMKEGIIVSTGSVLDAFGENNTPGKSGQLFSYNTNTTSFKRSKKGDRDLNKINKSKTYDVNIIEFDFIPFNNKVSFNYCFASEEYEDYVGSAFNDVFAFIVSGPRMRKKNVALLPNGEVVSINNVNHKKNTVYFVSNDCFINTGLYKNIYYKPKISFFQWLKLRFKKKGSSLYYIDESKKKKLNQFRVNNFQYDGFTNKLTATFYVIPYKKYHIKIAIGDVGDAIFDSGVFFEKGSFISTKDTSQVNFTDYQNISKTVNFDSLFGHKRYIPIINPILKLDEPPIFTDVFFDINESVIPDSSKIMLDKLVTSLKNNENLTCILWGYTDNTGKKKNNQKLSENRAKEVLNYLVFLGLSPDRIEYKGLNESNPIDSNNTEEGRAKNRRVEILIIEK